MTTSSMERTEQLSQLYRLLTTRILPDRYKVTAEKEVEDTSCGGLGVSPQLLISPKIGGYRGLIEGISEVS